MIHLYNTSKTIKKSHIFTINDERHLNMVENEIYSATKTIIKAKSLSDMYEKVTIIVLKDFLISILRARFPIELLVKNISIL